MKPEHINPEMIARYRASLLAPEELVALTDHLAGCASCRKEAATARDHGKLLESLVSPHMGFEELEALAKGGRNGRDHVANCNSCAAELADLQAFRASLQTPVTPWGGFRFTLPLTVVAALALMAILLRPTAPTKLPEQNRSAMRAETMVALRDGGLAVSLTFQGHLEGMSGIPTLEQAQIAEVLRSGRMPVVVNRDLNRSRETLLGSGEAGSVLRPLSPTGTVVATQRPVFRWTAPKRAREFRVAIYDDSFELVQSGAANDASDWTPATPLRRDRTYIWTVSALVNGRRVTAPHAPEPEARFRVATAEVAAAIEEATKSPARSNLRTAVLAARLGLRVEATAALDGLEKENPGSALVARLRASLQ